MRSEMHLPVLIFSLLLAAFLQSAVPLMPLLPLKIPLLSVVALYSALNRPVWMALVALLWAGALTDALGSLPVLTTPIFLLLLFATIRIVQRFVTIQGIWQGALLCGIATVTQTLWTVSAVQGLGVAGVTTNLKLALAALPIGLLAGFSGFMLCGLLDRLSGVSKPVKEGHGILWTKSNG